MKEKEKELVEKIQSLNERLKLKPVVPFMISNLGSYDQIVVTIDNKDTLKEIKTILETYFKEKGLKNNEEIALERDKYRKELKTLYIEENNE